MHKFAASTKSTSWIFSAEQASTTPPNRVVLGKSVSIFLLRYALFEFVAVACVSYLTSLVYSEVALSGWTAASSYLPSALLLAAGISTTSLCFKHYIAFQTRPRQRVLWNGMTAVVVTFSFFLSGLFLMKVATDYSRATFLFQLVMVGATVLCFRAIAHTRVREAIAKGSIKARRAIIIGEEQDHAVVARQLNEAGVNIVRSLPFPANIWRAVGKIERTELRRMVEACRAVRPDDIIILATSADLPRSARLADVLSDLPVSLHMVPVDTGALFRSAQLGEFGNLVTIELLRPPLTLVDRVLKRIFDVIAAGVGLLLLTPLFLAVAIAIKRDSRGPIFFRQTRHGYNNDTIRVFKFRTMTTTEDGHAFTQARKDDPRVTSIGRLLRRSSVDELPQLLNVLVGDMSIVGPRPHPVALNRKFEKHISPLSRRHNVKPGITGWAQVNGYRGETDTIEKMEGRFQHDLYYIDNWSFILDIKIIFMTICSRKAYWNAY